MTFPHSHAHSRTILGFLGGFSANNLCFLVFSSLCSRSVYYLSIAFSHSATLSEYALRDTQSHLCGSTSFPERQKKTKKNPGIIFCYLLLQMEPSFHDLAAFLAILPLRALYLFRLLSLSLFSWPLRLFRCLCLFRCISLSNPPPLPSPHPPAPACPAFVTGLVSITTATFLSCLTIFNQKRRKTEME